VPRSFTTVFGDPEDFQAALRAEGVVRCLVTGRGRFRARVTQILLHNLTLSVGEEELARIAFVAVPPGTVLVLLAIDAKPALVRSGIDMPGREIVTLGPGQRVHVRTAGPSRWAVIQMPDQDLLRYGRAVIGAEFAVPAFARWRPPAAAERNLRQLHRAAVRLARARSETLTDGEAAHGLEQQLIDGLLECLSTAPTEEETTAARRHRDTVARFEDLLRAEPLLDLTQIYTELGVPQRLLRVCCHDHLGMGPARYLRLCRMQQAYHVLRKDNPGTATISEIARRHGFRDPGRFAANYRALYGELPSATLRRSPVKPNLRWAAA
jgi:AraC-like DNA-binding protein